MSGQSVAVQIMKPLSLSSKSTLAHYTWTQQPTFLFASLCTVRIYIWVCQRERRGLEGKESTSSFVFVSGGIGSASCSYRAPLYRLWFHQEAVPFGNNY